MLETFVTVGCGDPGWRQSISLSLGHRSLTFPYGELGSSELQADDRLVRLCGGKKN